MEKIVIPASVASMGRAFVDCWSLKKVIIRAEKINANGNVFLRCSNELTINCELSAKVYLNKIADHYKIKSEQSIIKRRFFAGKFLSPHYLSIRIPDWFEKIEEEAFHGCTGLEHVVISRSVKCIETRAFSGCENLDQLITEEGLEVVGRYAFENCMRLKKLHLPDSLKEIKQFAFTGCTSLTGVSVSQHTQVSETAFDDNIKITYRQ